MYFYPLVWLFLPYLLRDWARSHFYFFAWVVNCNPPNKLWLLLAFFLLEIFCFALYKKKKRSEIPSNRRIPHAPQSTPVRTEYNNIHANHYNQSGKTGKTFDLFAHSSKFQNFKFRPKHKQNPTTLGTNCSKSECTNTIKGPQDQKHKSSRFRKKNYTTQAPIWTKLSKVKIPSQTAKFET